MNLIRFALLLALGGNHLLGAAFEARPLTVAASGKKGFTRVDAKAAGLHPTGEFSVPKDQPIRESHMSGLATADVDADGRVDVFVCGMDVPNALYRNLGDWKFENITEAAGVSLRAWRLNSAVFADVDGDGDPDLIVTSLLDRRNFLLLNDGKGHFTESLQVAWVNHPRGGSVGACLADIDGDGDLDLYTPNSEMTREHSEELRKIGQDALNAGQIPPPEFFEYFTVVDDGSTRLIVMSFVEDHLYLNDGKGGFKPVSDLERRFISRTGKSMVRPSDPGHEAIFCDLDSDGDPDLYVTSDFEHPDRLWINDGNGFFQESNPIMLRRTSQFSMGLDVSDINRDGHLDLITVDMLSRSHKRRKTQMGDMQVTEAKIGQVVNRPQIMQNTLHLNRGDNTFIEIAQYAGVKASEWSWGTIFSDVDLDGYEDLIVATGFTRDFMDSDTRNKVSKSMKDMSIDELVKTSEWYPPLPTRNVLYRNRGDLTFEYVSKDWGFEDEAVSGGVTQADLDGDGDLDLIFNNHGTPLEVYRNDTDAPRISVRLIGLRPNTEAIGAKVRLLGGPGGTAPMEHELQAGGGYASASDPLVVFGSGRVTNGLKLEVIWRSLSGPRRTVIEDVKPNHHYVIQQGVADPPYERPVEPPPATLFRNADLALAFSPTNGAPLVGSAHTEAPFDDFKYQSLLPNRLSQLGPSLAWSDLNADGYDDLIIGTGRGGGMVIYDGAPQGTFIRRPGSAARLDQAGILGWTDGEGNTRILSALANYEVPDRQFTNPPSVLSIELTTNSTALSLPGQLSTAGPMSLGDVDGDGDLDLFVGGRVNPTRYPEPADSKLYLNQGGQLILDTNNVAVLERIGLVSGAVFGDLDGDHDADLVLALEWGPVTILRNDKGRLVDATDEFGLGKLKGWWNSVNLGDFDGDGRLDIVAGNWGRNSKYEHAYSATQPLRIAYSDFDTNGVLDIVEYHFDPTLGQMVPERGRSCTTRAMPFIGERNPTFDVFGSRSLEEVYGDCLAEGTVLEANTLEHTLFLNRGAKFEPRALPVVAQFAPVFGLNVADFDGDGNEDLFVAQNFFASQRETPRSDGGRGLLMRGDGRGGLVPIPGRESGIRVYGEQRASAVSDFNRDGRPDLVVSQNGSFTRLYVNALGRPGLRVRLFGDQANPTGVGAVLRLRFGPDQLGPARIVTAGSGYWSQDSAVQVLAQPKPPTHIEVRWPDGTLQSKKVVAGVVEIAVVKAASQP